MKKLLGTVLIVALLLIPSVALAQNRARPFDYTYDSAGNTIIQPLRDGRVAVTIQGLHGYGTVCGLAVQGDSCPNPTAFEIDQDLRIVIEFTSAGIVGRTQGVLTFAAPIDIWEHAYFRLPVRGEFECVGSQPNPCRETELSLTMKGPVYDEQGGKVIGRVVMQTVGISDNDFDDFIIQFTGGDGQLRLRGG
jgi:hypothetical protein